MLKGIKKKWTDITIALALPLVIWNGATGIYKSMGRSARGERCSENDCGTEVW